MPSDLAVLEPPALSQHVLTCQVLRSPYLMTLWRQPDCVPPQFLHVNHPATGSRPPPNQYLRLVKIDPTDKQLTKHALTRTPDSSTKPARNETQHQRACRSTEFNPVPGSAEEKSR